MSLSQPNFTKQNSTKPNFICIGVQKGGTSWLYRQFLAHPQIFVPQTRKEIHFFNEYYERGVDWYEKWFDGAGNDKAIKAIGEVTPDYIYFDEVAGRMHHYDPNLKLIVMLRNPVERAYSHYRMVFQSGQGQQYKNFDDFMTRHPHAFKRGLYAQQIKHWFSYFKPAQFLFLTSEGVFGDSAGADHAFTEIGKLLNVDPHLFDAELAKHPVGKARPAPRFPALVSVAQKIRILLRDWDMDYIAAWFKKIGVTRQIFGTSSASIPALNDAERHKWMALYRDDIRALEEMFKPTQK